MKKNIIRFLKNTLLTTGLTFTLLSCVAFLLGGSCIFVRTMFQNLAANACFNLALLLIQRLESKYFFLDMARDITVAAVIALGFGTVFDWFSSTPPWIIILMVIITYFVGSLFQMFRVHDDISFINKELKQRRIIKKHRGVKE